MTLTVILLMLLGHFVADWLMQDDNMGKGKSSDNAILTMHVLLYTLGMVLITVWPHLFMGAKFALWIFLNSALHWITDYITSRQTKKARKTERWYGIWPMGFFQIIGLDQAIHYFTLFSTYFLIFK